MKILITGGTGFIGSYVVDLLLADGHELTLFARNPDKVSTFASDSRLKFEKGELQDLDRLRKATIGQDAVIHIALGWGDEPTTMLLNDTLPSIGLIEAAANANVKQFIYTSSTAAHGESRKLMGPDSKTRPTDFYGATKAATENYLIAASHQFAMQANIIRPGYTFGNPVVRGAALYSDRRFRQIVENALSGETIEVVKYDGTQFIWAGDLAKVYKAVLESSENREIFQGLSVDFASWETIATRAIALTNSSSGISVIDKGRDPELNLWDVSKIQCRFDLSFTCNDKIDSHLEYLIEAQTSI